MKDGKASRIAHRKPAASVTTRDCIVLKEQAHECFDAAKPTHASEVD